MSGGWNTLGGGGRGGESLSTRRKKSEMFDAYTGEPDLSFFLIFTDSLRTTDTGLNMRA